MGRAIVYWTLLAFAAGARAVAAAGAGVIPRDGISYVETARLVAHGDVRAALDGIQHPLLSLLGGLFGGSELATVAVACAGSALGALALIRIGERLHTRAAGVLAAALYGALPVLVRYQGAPLGEALSVPLGLWCIERALASRRRPGRGIHAGVLGGLAYLARPEALILPLVLVPALLLRRRWLAATFLALSFAAVTAPWVIRLSARAGEFTLSPKKPAARFVGAEEGFDAKMVLKGVERPAAAAAALETLRTWAEALAWVLLPLAAYGAVLLLLRKGPRADTLVLLAVLAADLALRYRLLQLHGYLGQRHLVFAAALTLPFAARAFPLSRRWAGIVGGLLVAGLLVAAVLPRNTEKIPLKTAGQHILAKSGPGARVATYLTPRISYYAFGEDVKLQRMEVVDRRALAGQADWLAIVPGRMEGVDEETRRSLVRAAAGLPAQTIGEGEWQVRLFRLPPR